MTSRNWQAQKVLIPAKACAVALLLLGAAAAPALASDAKQSTFPSPQRAVDALIVAMRDNGTSDLVNVLGPKSDDLLSSGDPIADRDAREKFIQAFAETHTIVSEGKGKALLMLGTAEWPFPIPIVKAGSLWHFDAAAGREEILNRRIGRNELNAIDVCRTYVEAQNTYVHDERFVKALPAYAQKILSTPGTHDGLYWQVAAGEEQSPLGPLVASARAEGYDPEHASDGDRKPYHGYLYKVLTRQGKAAPGGAHDYIVDGHMIGGFALIAFPARYGDSGVMTFIVNHDGVVYQRNLGPNTVAEANKINAFNPDAGWEKQ